MMTFTTKNLLVGLITGTAIGLMIGLLVCSAAYAGEMVWAYPFGHGKEINLSAPCPIGDAALTNTDRLITCHGTKGWSETQMIPSPCEQKMESAMRAMEPYIPKFIDPVERRRHSEKPEIYTEPLCLTPSCGSLYFGDSRDTRSLEQRLADAARAHAREQEELGEQLVKDELERYAYRQWAEAKACWIR